LWKNETLNSGFGIFLTTEPLEPIIPIIKHNRRNEKIKPGKNIIPMNPDTSLQTIPCRYLVDHG